MADFTTIIEHKGSLDGIKLAFVGDGNNNVTHSLALGCSMLGMDFSVAAPVTDQMAPEIVQKCMHCAALLGPVRCRGSWLFFRRQRVCGTVGVDHCANDKRLRGG